MHVPQHAIAEPVLAICRRLAERGHRGWLVGGSLRDLVRGERGKDWDIATTARPNQVRRWFDRVIPTGIQHGTVTVLWNGDHYEVTTLRGETTYTDGRRPDAVFFVDDIRRDLARRDFTVNAMAYDPLAGELVDPFGGMDDLERGIVRAVGDPAERFNEDGLRVLRAARFVATLEFDLDPTTEQAIPAALETYRKVSHERVRDEWIKAMAAAAPSRAFEIMRRSGILTVTFPELLEQVGCEQNHWHAYDVWTHTLHCVDLHEGGPIERMAALLHDVGKPRARRWSDEKGDWTFLHHERIGADIADRWLRELRFSNDERETVVHLVRHHLLQYSSDWTDAAVRRFVRRVGPEHLEPLLRLARADARAKGRDDVEQDLARLEELHRRIDAVLAEGPALSARELAISGRDVMQRLQVRPGPIVGRVLARLADRVLEEPELNQRERLLALVDEVAEQLGAPEGREPGEGTR